MKKLIEVLTTGLLMFLIFVAACVLIGFLGALPLYFLWNWLMPDLFALKTVTFWQAWGLFFLCSMLFKSPAATTNNENKK